MTEVKQFLTGEEYEAVRRDILTILDYRFSLEQLAAKITAYVDQKLKMLDDKRDEDAYYDAIEELPE